MSASNSHPTETTGVLSWFADSDAAPRVTLAYQDLLCPAFVSPWTEGAADHVSFENVLFGADVPVARCPRSIAHCSRRPGRLYEPFPI